ncbi:pyridoxamine 5'-phosphate oxidase family protein [Streptomyces uncialis]|uniref:Nitrilase n=1 Tax=Streptomyces uncialis TaxID=1048205 RepID=A0A1Q4VCU2_9ACTN|nr:pyridoxamine 5'-phosphate oxidase family protein [Streptomyces uncialis]MCX4661209.1 pyridoxamine 5'-phosphate oxidase family protein [Streptomyces uncialis]OKH95653.1 nitrilase [Streptomyces uncialis]
MTSPAAPSAPDPAYLAFWQERHLCTLTTLRPDGTPHVVPVGVTYEHGAGEKGIARVITNRTSRKVANILAAAGTGSDADGGTARVPVAVCQVDGGRWATLEGHAEVVRDPDRIADAVTRYATRYGRTPAPNPQRVLIEITVTKSLGRA